LHLYQGCSSAAGVASSPGKLPNAPRWNYTKAICFVRKLEAKNNVRLSSTGVEINGNMEIQEGFSFWAFFSSHLLFIQVFGILPAWDRLRVASHRH
jgi:hypothetical protein